MIINDDDRDLPWINKKNLNNYLLQNIMRKIFHSNIEIIFKYLKRLKIFKINWFPQLKIKSKNVTHVFQKS